MNIEIDTQSKTIKIKGKIILNDFWQEIQTMLPNGTWREYTLEQTIEFVSYPVIQPIPQIQPWYNPPYNPNPIIYTTGTNPYTVTLDYNTPTIK